LLDDAPTYRETHHAYERFVGDYGPDDYFVLKTLIERRVEALSEWDILAAIKLSGHDARLFGQMLPRLLELLPTLSENQRLNLLLVLPRIWETYYPMGEAEDLAADLGDLLLALNANGQAIQYYTQSLALYGPNAEVQFKIAVCHCLLGEFDAASPLIAALRKDDPENQALQDLIQEFESKLDLA
jgi:hypothetical protein